MELCKRKRVDEDSITLSRGKVERKEGEKRRTPAFRRAVKQSNHVTGLNIILKLFYQYFSKQEEIFKSDRSLLRLSSCPSQTYSQGSVNHWYIVILLLFYSVMLK